MTCPTCGASVASRYCGECGERMLGERDHSFMAFAGEAASEAFSFDNRLWRTVRALPRPGLLTAEYVAGRRRPYLSPVQVFLLLTIVFFLLGPDLGLGGTSFARFEQSALTRSAAEAFMEAATARTGIERDALVQRFDATAAAQQRFMILLAVPVFALLLKLLYPGRSYVTHLAFSTHAIASLLVLLFVYLLALFLLLAVAHPLLMRVTSPTMWPPGRTTAIAVTAAPVVVFLHIALRRVHGGGRVVTAAKAVAATVALSLSLAVYEALLFFTTAFAVYVRS